MALTENKFVPEASFEKIIQGPFLKSEDILNDILSKNEYSTPDRHDDLLGLARLGPPSPVDSHFWKIKFIIGCKQ